VEFSGDRNITVGEVRINFWQEEVARYPPKCAFYIGVTHYPVAA
jgi:hypothetical protein